MGSIVHLSHDHAGKFRICAALLLIMALWRAGDAQAAVATWTGAGGSANWSDTGNWVGNAAPGANGDTVVFDINSTAQLTNNNFDLTFTGLIIQVNNSFAGGAITINGAATLTPGSITLASTTTTSLTLNLPVAVATAQTWTLNGNTLTTLGSITATSANLALTGSASNMATLIGAITLNSSTLTVTGSAAATTAVINGSISGTGGALTLSSTNLGTVTLGSPSNAYTGATTINSGILSFFAGAQLNTSPITLAGQNASTNLAKLVYTGATDVLSSNIALGTVSSGNVIDIATAGTVLSHTGNITGGNATGTNVSLLVNGPGILSLENPTHANNTFTGGVTVDTAGLRLTGDAGTAGDPLLLGPGGKTIVIQNAGRLITLGTTTINMTASPNTKLFSIGTGGGTFDISSGANFVFNVAATLAGTGLLTIKGNGGTNYVQFGVIGGAAVAVNTHTGGMTVDNATISLSAQGNADPTFLGTGAQTVTLQNGGRLLVQGAITGQTNADFNATNPKSIAMGTGGGILECASGFALTLNDAGQMAAGNGGTATIRGAGTVTWGSTTAATVAIAHTGPVVIDGGNLNVVGQGSADPTNLGPGVKTVTIQNGGTLHITATTGSGLFDPSANTKSFIIGTGGGTIDTGAGISCIFNDANQLSGSGTLTKIGAGTLIAGQQTVGYGGGAGYTGGQVNVNAGTLSLRNTLGLGGGAGGSLANITLAAGTTLALLDDGNATFGNNVTVNGNATITVDRNTTTTNSVLSLGNLTVGAFTLTVNGNNGFALAVGGTTTLTGAATLNNAAPVYLNGDLNGSFTLAKNGLGTLVYDGTQIGTTGITVNAGTLSGIGTLLGAVSVGAAGIVAPGDLVLNANQIGTLVLNGGIGAIPATQYIYQLGTASDLIDAGSANVTVTGSLNALPAAGFATGTTYHLLQSTGTITNNMTIGTLPANNAGTIVVTPGTPNTLDLVTFAPTTFTWNGSAGDGEWTTGGNWVGGVAPPAVPNANNAALVFPAGQPLVTHNGYATDTNFNSITFADNYVVTGNRLFINALGGLVVNAGTPTLNLDLSIGEFGAIVTLAASSNLIIGTGTGTNVIDNSITGFAFTLSGAAGPGSATCTINSLVSGSGNVSVTDSGSGTAVTLVLNAANSYTGITTISSGGTISANTLANGGVRSNIGAATNAAANLVLAGGTLLYTGGTASTNHSFTLTADSTVSIPAGVLLTLTGTNSGAFNVIKAGAGTLALSGTVDNVALSATVNAGVLSLAKTPSQAAVHAIGGKLTVNNGGIAQLNGTNGDQIYTGANVVINAGGTLDMHGLSEGFNQLNGAGTITNSLGTFATLTIGESNGTDTFSGVIQNNLNVIKRGTGTETLTGASTFKGSVTMNGGTLALSGASNLLPATATVIFASTSTLDLGNNPQTVAGITLLDVASMTATLANATAAAPLTTPLITIPNINVAGATSNVTSFTGNTPTTLTGGTINIGGGLIDAGSFGVQSGGATATYKVVASTLIGTGGVSIKSFGDTADGGSGPQHFTLSGTNTFTGGITVLQGFIFWTKDAALGDPNNSITLVGTSGLLSATAGVTVTLGAGHSIFLSGIGDRFYRGYGAPNGNIIVPGNLSGTGNLRTTDGGTITFQGTNTNTGGMTICSTTKIIGGADNSLSAVSPVNIVATGTLDTGGFNVAVGSLTSATASTAAIGTGTLTIGGDNSTASYSGVLTGSGTLNKTGNGVQTFTSATLTAAFTGPININGGTLAINGTETVAPGLHSVNSGGTLAGTGTVLGSVTLAPGGSPTPGNLAPSTTLTLSSATAPLTMVPGSFLNILLTSAPETSNTVTAGNSFLSVPSGTAAFGGGTLNIIGTSGAGTYRIANIASISGTLTPGLAPPGLAITAITTSAGGAGQVVDVTLGAALTYTWSGGGADTNWTTAANWNLGVGPAPVGNAGETLVFPATATTFTANNNFPASTAFASIQLAGNFTLTGNSVLLGISPAVLTSTAGTSTITMDIVPVNGTIVVNAGSSLTIGTIANSLNNGGSLLTLNNAGTLIINSVIAGAGGLTQSTGAGTTTLNGANTYGGVTTISTGTVVLGNATALGAGLPTFTSSASTSIASGATLDLNGQTISESITPAGTGVGGIGAIINNNATTAATVSGIVQGTAAYSVGGSGDITFSGQVATQTLTKIGNNTLTFSGTQDNNSVAVIASAGTVILAKTSSAVVHAVGSGLTINTGAVAKLAGTSTFQFAVSQPLTINGGTLDMNGNNAAVGTFSGSGGTLTDNSAGTGTSTLTVNAAGSGTYQGTISDGPTRTLALLVAGTAATNELILTNPASTFTGGVIVNSGRIQANASTVGSPGAITSGPFGKGAITVNSATPTASAGGEVYFNAAGVSIANNFIVAGRSGEGFGALRFDPSGSITVSGNITLTGDTRIGQANANSPVVSLTGTISGTANLEFFRNNGGSPVFILNNTTGNPSNWTGNTLVQVGARLSLGAPNQIPDGPGFGDVVLNGILDLAGFSETVNGLSGIGTIDNSVAGTPTLTVGNNNATAQTFSGVIQNTAGTVSLAKIGAGNLTFSNNGTFGGGITINAGTVTSGNVTSMGTGTITLSGGTLSLLPQVQLTGTGWNQDNVRAAVDPAATPFGTTGFVDNGTYIYYEAGTAGAPANSGLPPSLFVANANNGIVYKLLPYSGGGNNDLEIQGGGTNTGTITVSNGTLLTSLHILDVGGSGAATYTTTLTFTDTTSTVVSGGAAADWFNGTNADGSAAVATGVGRFNKLTAAYDAAAPAAGNPRLYEYTFNLAPADALKTVASIKITNTTVTTTEYLNVFAITGTQVQTYLNNVVVNANSTIDMQSAGSVTLGALSIGSNMLSFTGVSGASVTLGATALNGNATFNPAVNTTLTLGSLNDGGTSARTITQAGLGTLAIGSAAASLIDGTALNVNAGTLNSSNGTALGSLANATLAPGATLAINANQVLGALNGTGGSTTLNTHTLTVGSTNNLNSTFSGVIADGTGSGSLIKAGTGSLTLKGVNTYSGATTVNSGSMTVSAGASIASSSSSVSNGALLTVNGTSGAVAVNGSTAATPAQLGSRVRGIGTVGAVTAFDGTNGNASVWPGTTISANSLSGNETLTCSSVDFTGGGKLTALLRHNGGTPVNQKLISNGFVTIPSSTSPGTAATLSFAITDNANTTDSFVVLDTGTTTANISTAFGIIKAGSLAQGPAGGGTGGDFDLIYRDTTASAKPDIVNPANGLPLPNNVSQVLVKFKSTSVTPVTLEAFAAKADGAGVLLSWNAVSEIQNLGFNLYRRPTNEPRPQGSGNGWTRVNPMLIAGRITSPDFKSYRFYDWAELGAYEYKLESVSARGASETFEKRAGPVSVDSPSAALTAEGLESAVASVAFAGESKRGAGLSAKLAAVASQERTSNALKDIAPSQLQPTATPVPTLAFDAHGKLALPAASIRELSADGEVSTSSAQAAGTARARAAAAHDTSSAAVAARWFSSSVSRSGSYTGAKVTYSTPGVLKIPAAILPAGFNMNRLSIMREGRAQTALALTTDGLIVYGQGYQDDYTDKDAIFLRNSSAPTAAGVVMHAQGLFAGNQAVNVDSPASVSASYHDVYFDYNYRPYTFPPWFSSQYLTGGSTQSFSIDTPNASSGAGSLLVNLWSLTETAGVSPDHALQVFVNGQPAGQATWTGGNKMMQLSFQLASGVLNNGVNQIDLVTPALDGVDSGTGTAGQISFLHSMSMSYTQLLDASKPVNVLNAGIQSKLFELGNAPSADAWIVDARYPDRAALVAYESQAQADGSFKLRFNAPAGGSGLFLVVPAGQENLPVAVSKRQIKPVSAAAYLAIGPSQFGAGVQPLLLQHSKEGLRGTFVDQEQAFDYYNYGRYGPAGIQNAVRAVRPQYLLLLGRTTYDYRNYSGLNVDPLCPAFLVSTTMWAQATSDSMFGDLGRGYPELAVGRLPVNDASELSSAVKHVFNNVGLSTGYRVHAAADRADADAGNFAAEADAIAQAHPELAWQANYLGVTYQTSSEVTAALTAAANGGADLLLYVGHGNAVRLGKDDPRILETDGIADTVKNLAGNAVFLQSTCTANWMAKNETGYQSIAIQALTQPQGGISASIASSTYMNSQNATEFMTQLLTNAGTSQRWGNALLKTQQWAYAKASGFYMDLSKTEQIFGDPAMPIFSKIHAGSSSPGTTPGNF